MKNMTQSINENDEDVPELVTEFETTAGRQITMGELSQEEYTIHYIQEKLDQIVDVGVPPRDVWRRPCCGPEQDVTEARNLLFPGSHFKNPSWATRQE